MNAHPEHTADPSALRQLLDDYLQMYASRDERLTKFFSEDFSGFTGGGNFLVKDLQAWIAITRQDFAQVKDSIRIELKDTAIQSLTDSIAVATAFFTIHLPIKDHILSRETARLVLIFRKESAGWKICHSSISIPYQLVRKGEVYPLKELTDRTHVLEKLVAERTAQLSEANERLKKSNSELAREIAERKQTAEALQKSEERYRSILHASPDDITITDREGRILMVSPAAFKIFGFEREADYLGRSVTEYIVAEDRERAMTQVTQRLQGAKSGPTEYRGLRRDGSTFDIEVNSEFIRDSAETPIGMVIISRDISERKRAEEERQKLEAQNQQLHKAESLGRMAGAIAHHFNNQLQTVTMSLELALDELPKKSSAIDYVTAAMQSARTAAEISNLMLTYLGITAANREPLDLSIASLECLPLLRAIIPKTVVFETDLPAHGPIIAADSNRIQHVLTNLITNAWEAIGTAMGKVRVTVKTVSATTIPTTHRFPVDWQPQATAYACLIVSDTGNGIAEQDIAKIFDPFFSTKFTGRGMGLAVVLGIARTLDGVITVESALGCGSSFRVFLPVCRQDVFQKHGVSS